MANHSVNNPTFNSELRMYEVTDRGHANTFNANEDVLIKNDVYLKNQIETIKLNNTTSNSDLNTHKNNTNIHVTTAEKQTWNSKASTSLATTTQNGLMSAADKQTINDLSTTINNSVTGQKVLSEIKKVDGTGSGLDADLLDGKEASAFSLTNHSHNNATTSQNGFMSAQQVKDLNDVKSATSSDTLASTINNAVTSTQTINNIFTKIKDIDGSGSKLDADLLDGKEASAFALLNHSHSEATEEQSGFMSKVDKICTNLRNGEDNKGIAMRGCTTIGDKSVSLGSNCLANNYNIGFHIESYSGDTVTVLANNMSTYNLLDGQKVTAYCIFNGEFLSSTGATIISFDRESIKDKIVFTLDKEISMPLQDFKILVVNIPRLIKNTFNGYDEVKAYRYSTTALGAANAAIGLSSTVVGMRNFVVGDYSYAEGHDNIVSSDYAHAQNRGTIANAPCSTAIGTYNKKMKEGDLFVIGKGSSNSRSNIFRVSKTAIYGTGAYNTSGADYAEYFEWLDQNPNNEDRVGKFVTLDGDKIRIASSKDNYILGVVSGSPSIIGNSYNDQWQGMHVKDDFGRVIYEDVEIPAKYETIRHEAEYKSVEDKDTGEISQELVKEAYDEKVLIEDAHTERCPKLNPDYKPNQEFIGREKRKEWDCIGMLGVLNVYDDGTCKVNSYCKVTDNGIATSSDTGYRVLKRVNDNIIKILFR